MQDQAPPNYASFRRALPTLLVEHRGQHALLRNGAVLGYYPTSIEAIKGGLTQFGEGNFSVELVDDVVEDLGFYSHVSAALHA